MLDFFIITFVICLFTMWWQVRPFFWRGKGILWKTPFPLMGNTGTTFYKPWNEFWPEFYKEIGDERLCGFHYFATPAILLKDPELIKQVMITDADNFLSREFYLNGDRDPLGKSLFFSGGLQWKGQRARLTPYFTPLRIKSMVNFLHPVTDRFTQYIVDEGKTGPVDAYSTSHKLATDVIMSNVFGLQPDCFENPNSFFFNLQKELISFDLGIRAMISILAPKVYNFLGLKFLRSSTTDKLTTFVSDVMNQRSKGVGVRPDFLQGMMELMKKDADNFQGDNIAKFDNHTVVGQCMLMYGAGTETTGNTLAFLLYELALNPDIQDKVREELNTMIQKTSGEYGFEDLNKLSYTNNVISETLRKYPIATTIGRTCTKRCVVDGLEILEGTKVIIPILGLHRDAAYFPDPMKFDPERFSADGSITPGTYLPFGLGPRTCIGMKFALTEIVLSLCKLLPKQRLSPCEKTEIPITYSSNPTLSARNKIWLSTKPID